MFERFTDKARRVVVLAQEEARRLNHNYIGTEHILLGLLAVDDGVAQRALELLGVSRDEIRRRVVEVVGSGDRTAVGHIPFTSDAKNVLEHSLREAIQLGHNYIDTEHILLGLVRPGDNVACQVLMALGVEQSRVRQTVMQLLTEGETTESTPRAQRPVPIAAPRLATCTFCGRDVWDVRYYVIGAHGAICQECVKDSRSVIDHAIARGTEPGALRLPPRISGEPPDTTSAELIVDAFLRVFGAKEPDSEFRTRPVEDVESLVPAMEEAASRYPDVGPASFAVTRIRFRSDDAADVRFSVMGFPFEGCAVHEAGTWKVSRDTYCLVLARGGISCPPRDE